MSSKLKVFSSPERYVQGRNATDHLGAEMKKLALKGPVVVVSTPSPKKLLEERWTKSLKENGYEFTQVDFKGVCTIDEMNRVKTVAEETNAKTIVAFGGGQTIDVCRSACCEVGDGSVCTFVSCPTVASTDAPCSGLCVMYHANRSFHQYRFSKRHPALVLVDTAACAAAPTTMLRGGLGDALATWYEARTIREACSENFLNGMPTETSTALAKLSCDILMADGAEALKANEAKVVTPALERVVEANTLLSGLGFENGGLCVAHSVHNGLTTQPQCAKYTHGEKVAFGIITQLTLEGRPTTEINKVLEFCTTVGLPVTLKQLEVDVSNEKAVKEVAERALAPGESAHKEPFEVTVEMLVDAIRGADKTGAVFLEQKAS